MRSIDDLIHNYKIKFLTMHFYYRIEKFVRDTAKKYDKKGSSILDIGAGECRYRYLFQKSTYDSSDISQNSTNSIDYVADINYGIKQIKSNSYDNILCIQVLEHLKFPHTVYKEFYRILKPGGKLFLSTNFVAHMHMIPHDYFRFTKYGLIMLGEENGFKVTHITEHGGIFHVLSYLLNTFLIRLVFRKVDLFYALYLVVFMVPIILLNLLATLLDNLDTHRELTMNYEVIYQKIK